MNDKSKQDLILPVYLNQRRVFDLVAMLQGGIATVTRVIASEQEASKVAGSLSGGFGLAGALASLLKIDVSGKGSAGASKSSDARTEEERVHTPASLFQRVREMMMERAIVQLDAVGTLPQPGTFFEFTAAMQTSGVAAVIDWCAEAFELAGSLEIQGHNKQERHKHAQEQAQLKKQIESMQTALRSGDTFDLTTPELLCGARAVVTLERQYLNDPSMTDLVDGTFRVLGKVIRTVEAGQGAISLLRKTVLARFQPAQLAALVASLNQGSAEFSFGTVEHEIDGPVIQLIPVAIFA